MLLYAVIILGSIIFIMSLMAVNFKKNTDKQIKKGEKK